MKARGKAIVVGWDFSEFSNHALDHALFYSYQTNMEICLVHIVKRKSQVKEMEVELKKVVAKVYQEKGKHLKMMVRAGKITSGLRAAAIEVSAAVIFIGTHGVKGIQNYIGSNTLKIILNSVIPFVVVQAPRKVNGHFSVVCPIDSRKESKEVLYWVTYLAKILDANISLVYPDYKTPVKVLLTKANVNFSKHYLHDSRINFKEEKLSCKRFNDAIVDFANKKKVDLILTITNRQTKVQNLFSAAKVQYLIANREKIPVLCVSPRRDLWKYGSYK